MSNPRLTKTVFLLGAALGAVLAADAAHAQDATPAPAANDAGLGEIVVTAERRADKIAAFCEFHVQIPDD